MNLLRTLLVALFAIVLAMPACCCTSDKTGVPASHCCDGKEKDERSAPCDCFATTAKQLEEPSVAPAFPAPGLPVVVSQGTPTAPVTWAPVARATPEVLDPIPSRQRLAMLRRLRI